MVPATRLARRSEDERLAAEAWISLPRVAPLATRPEWNLEPRPDEAVPPSLDDFLEAVACGAADTIRGQSATDGFLASTSVLRL